MCNRWEIRGHVDNLLLRHIPFLSSLSLRNTAVDNKEISILTNKPAEHSICNTGKYNSSNPIYKAQNEGSEQCVFGYSIHTERGDFLRHAEQSLLSNRRNRRAARGLSKQCIPISFSSAKGRAEEMGLVV